MPKRRSIVGACPPGNQSRYLTKETLGVVVSVLFGIVQAVAPMPEHWKPLAFSFFLFFLIVTGLLWLCAHFPRMGAVTQRHKRSSLALAAVLFIGFLYLGWPRPMPAPPDFVRGGHYPKLNVELYWGPTNGMPRTATLAESHAALCVISYENTNTAPIYDLSIAMFDPWECAEKFNKGMGKIPILNRHLQHTVFADMAPSNRVHCTFRVDTRAGVTLHRFNYVMAKDFWVHSNNVVDMDTQQIIVEDVSPGFAQVKPEALIIEYSPKRSP